MDSSPAGGDGGVPRPVYDEVTVDGCGRTTGYQTVLAVAGSRVALASLSFSRTTGQCQTMNGPMEVGEHQVCYAESTGGAFTTAIAATEQYLALTGVALALEASGRATIAFTGGPPAAQRCGGSDLRLVSGTGGSFGAPTTVATGSASAALVPDMAAQCVQDVCNLGDATGFWPAMVLDSSANPVLASRDIHYGFADTDFASSDVEIVRRPSSSVTTIDVSRGGGTYLRIGLDPAGEPVVAHYNADGTSVQKGIWIHRRVGGAWQAARVSTARAGEQLGFGVNQAGLHAIAFYDSDKAKLVYLESAGGATWSEPVSVDTDGIVGQQPSLAFDAAGEPAIAYYRCNDYHPSDRNCSPGRDGLRLARRASGQWRVHTVRAEDGVFDGLYPALGFVGGKAVIAFQSRWFDPSTSTNDVRLHAARER